MVKIGESEKKIDSYFNCIGFEWRGLLDVGSDDKIAAAIDPHANELYVHNHTKNWFCYAVQKDDVLCIYRDGIYILPEKNEYSLVQAYRIDPEGPELVDSSLLAGKHKNSPETMIAHTRKLLEARLQDGDTPAAVDPHDKDMLDPMWEKAVRN